MGIYKKEKQKQSGLGEEMSCYVDASRNIAVLLDSTALANERMNKRLSGASGSNVSPTLYYKQAKHFMSKKEYEKGLKYLYTAIGLCGNEEEREENGTGKIIGTSVRRSSGRRSGGRLLAMTSWPLKTPFFSFSFFSFLRRLLFS